MTRKIINLLLISTTMFCKLSSYEYCFEGLFEHSNDNSRYGLIQKIIDPSDTILEAGGFDGGDTIHLVKIVPKGKIIVFEPNPSRYTELLEKTKNISIILLL